MDSSKGLGITVLGSGSLGNASLVHSDEGCILVDAGFSGRELESRIRAVGASPGDVRAILISHEHSDHVKGCRIFADRYGVPTYLTRGAHDYLKGGDCLGKDRTLFSAGTPFELCGIRIDAFSVQHDASDPVGFVFSLGRHKIGFATDLGCINGLGRQRLKGCGALILESNHDMDMLRRSGRPLHIKRRIMGMVGHLSNDAALDSLEELLTEATKCVVLAHLSRECNDCELLARLANERLAKLNRTDILLMIAEQSAPTETVWLR